MRMAESRIGLAELPVVQQLRISVIQTGRGGWGKNAPPGTDRHAVNAEVTSVIAERQLKGPANEA